MSGKQKVRPEKNVEIVRQCLKEEVGTHKANRSVGVETAVIRVKWSLLIMQTAQAVSSCS